MKKYLERFDKYKQLEYLDHVIRIAETHIAGQYTRNEGFAKITVNIDTVKKIKKLRNDLYFSDNKTVSYFTKTKISNFAKTVDLWN